MDSHDQNFEFDVVMFQIESMAEDVQPLLAEFRDSGLLKEVENLTRSLTQASEDLRLFFYSPLVIIWLRYACHKKALLSHAYN